MSQKKLFWLAGSAAIVAGVVLGISTVRARLMAPPDLTLVAAPADDDEKKGDESTSNKKKKAMEKRTKLNTTN